MNCFHPYIGVSYLKSTKYTEWFKSFGVAVYGMDKSKHLGESPEGALERIDSVLAKSMSENERIKVFTGILLGFEMHQDDFKELLLQKINELADSSERSKE